MNYNFDTPVDRHNTYSMKWDFADMFFGEVKESGKDPLCVFTADMDFVCADSIKQELQKVVDKNLYGYSALFAGAEACKPYYDAVINWFDRRYGWKIQAEDIIYCPGTVKAIENAIRAFSEEGDGILINPPIYSPFAMTIQNTKRKVVRSPLINHDGYYTVDFADFEEKAKDPNTKLCILRSPHNPTGRVWTAEELEKDV